MSPQNHTKQLNLPGVTKRLQSKKSDESRHNELVTKEHSKKLDAKEKSNNPGLFGLVGKAIGNGINNIRTRFGLIPATSPTKKKVHKNQLVPVKSTNQSAKHNIERVPKYKHQTQKGGFKRRRRRRSSRRRSSRRRRKY